MKCYKCGYVWEERKTEPKACPSCKSRAYATGRKYAHGVVHSAKAQGDLIPQPCEVCGLMKVEAHHTDYEKPLVVNWLCRKHHKEVHSKPKEQKGKRPVGRPVGTIGTTKPNARRVALKIRWTAEEIKEVEVAAEKEGITVSSFIREAALARGTK